MGREKLAGEWTKVPGWDAGRAWRDPDGTLTFYIRKQVAGVRRELNTGATSLRAALKQLERFEAEPDAYRPGGDPAAAPLELDNGLSKDFLAWSLVEKGNTKAWVRKQQLALAWWMDRLRGVNLRRADLAEHILPHLNRTPGKATKIRVLKGFYSWLRKERHLVKAAQDPTYGALVAPQAKPAQWGKSKVVPREHFLLVLEHLTSPWREALHVQAGTGWHTSEVVRFAADGAIEPLPKTMRVENGAAGVLVCPLHKSGDIHRTAVTAEVLEAAKQLRAHVARMAEERAANHLAVAVARAEAEGLPKPKKVEAPGSFSREWYERAVRAACAVVKRPDGEVGIPPFSPGRMRHSTATWAIEAGASPAAVSAFLGHKSPVTTKRFYAVHATVPKVPTLV